MTLIGIIFVAGTWDNTIASQSSVHGNSDGRPEYGICGKPVQSTYCYRKCFSVYHVLGENISVDDKFRSRL